MNTPILNDEVEAVAKPLALPIAHSKTNSYC